MRKLITLTSDFAVQSQSVGVMEAVALSISPKSNVVHLMHGLPSYDVRPAARTLESIQSIPVGFHVCVCDPGVGTSRKAIICLVGRGDFLVGPDNGVLLPACRMLGGITSVHQIANTALMRTPISPIFHGRDVFVPAAAFLAEGIPVGQFGPELSSDELVDAAYGEAVLENGVLRASVIQINKFGSAHVNITHEVWETFNVQVGTSLQVELPGMKILWMLVGNTFGDVGQGQPLILKDDYGRIEVAMNLGSFVEAYPIRIGDPIAFHLPRP